MSDLLRMDYINSLPQPFVAYFLGGSEWPVVDIDVETGLLRIDVCGLLEVKHIGDVMFFRDSSGIEHHAETFYNEDDQPDLNVANHSGVIGPLGETGIDECAAMAVRGHKI